MRSGFRSFSRTLVVGALSLSGLALVTFVPASAVGATGSNVSQVSPSATPVESHSGVKVLGWGFDRPAAVTSDATHVWVANWNGDSVTELSASTGALVKVIRGPSYGFDYPCAITSDGSHVWVANHGGIMKSPVGPDSESAPEVELDHQAPDAYGDSVTELSASTGAPVKLVRGRSYGRPILSDGTHLWVANANGNSVTELSASTGALVRVINASSYGFDGPTSITSDGTHVWVANYWGNSVTEFSAS